MTTKSMLVYIYHQKLSKYEHCFNFYDVDDVDVYFDKLKQACFEPQKKKKKLS